MRRLTAHMLAEGPKKGSISTERRPTVDKYYFMLQQLVRDSDAIAGRLRRHYSRHHSEHVHMKGDTSGDSVPKLFLLENINARRAKGESFASIAAELNKQGVTGGYGGRWYASSVWMYLQRWS
jgi:hypothetical protein